MKMKKATTTLLAGLILIGSAAFATGSETGESKDEVKIIPTASSDTYKLMYTGEEEGAVRVKFYDGEGRLFFTDIVRSKGKFIRPYNFANLPAGSYKIEVISPAGSSAAEVMHVKPVSGIVDVALTPVDSAKKIELVVKGVKLDPVYVKIFDKYSRLITEDYIDVENSFKKVYNLERIPSEGFVFEIISDNKVVKKAML